MFRTLQYKISQEAAGKTVLSYLRAQGFSRHLLGGLKPYPDAVLRNGSFVRMSSTLREGDVLTVTLRDEEDSEHILAVPVPFTIVYEDEDILVVDKPAGISIHPAPGHPADTLANGVAHFFAERGIPYVFRCINRLDRDTTGLLILANNALASAVLTEDLQRRTIHRTYVAVAHGHTEDSGTIDLPIARKPGSLVERCVDERNGQRAVTHYRTLARFPDFSLLELHLDTGRTHQIRVHMTAIGHPLVGDTLYTGRDDGPSPFSEDANSGCKESLLTPTIPRQALHSWKLEFTHPITKEAMRFTAPLPDDMRSLLSNLPGGSAAGSIDELF